VGYFKTLTVSNVKLFTNHEFEVVVACPRSILVRIAGVMAEVQTEHLPNANLQRYRYTSLFGIKEQEP
jgi:hypothetical protein